MYRIVADVAELEMLRQKAKHAAHAQPFSAPVWSSLRAERLCELPIFLHPSGWLIQSRFPIVTIWENNRNDDGDGMIERWDAEAAVVARPFLKVEVRRLPSGGYARKNCGNGRRDRNRSLSEIRSGLQLNAAR
jgi:hypothetical protein